MSRHAEVVFEWGDGGGPGEKGEYTFRLPIGELRRLQEKCDAGPAELLTRLLTRRWRLDDPRETIRLGLIGGGSIVTDAGAPDDRRINRLILEYVDNRPLMDSVAVAARILDAALSGAKDEDIPKSVAAEGASQSSLTESSPLPPSTLGDQSSDTPQAKLTPSPSGSSEPARLATSPRRAGRKSSSLPAETNSTR